MCICGPAQFLQGRFPRLAERQYIWLMPHGAVIAGNLDGFPSVCEKAAPPEQTVKVFVVVVETAFCLQNDGPAGQRTGPVTFQRMLLNATNDVPRDFAV